MNKEARKSSLVWLFLALGIVVLIFIRGRDDAVPSGVDHPSVNVPLVTLAVSGLTGVDDQPPPADVRLSDLKGQVVLLNLWGPWCGPCRQELPEIGKIDQQFSSRSDFRLLAVAYPSMDTDSAYLRSDTLECLNKLGVNIPTYVDPTQTTSQAVDFMLGDERHGFPANLVLDRRGIVRGIWLGYSPQSVEQIRDLITELLAEPAGEREKVGQATSDIEPAIASLTGG